MSTNKPEMVLVEDHKGKPMTTSLVVAEVFGREHQNVMKSVRRIIAHDRDQVNFNLVDYTDAKGQMRPMFLMDRDGFTLLAMGFTGSKALEWKKKYIHAFNEMEKKLSTPMSALDVLKHQVVVMEEHEKRLDGVDTRLDAQEYDRL